VGSPCSHLANVSVLVDGCSESSLLVRRVEEAWEE
jgi:hypothetical protein